MASRKRKTTKPLLLLLDACVVIEAYGLGVWDVLMDRARIAAPSTVVRDEALFYSKDEQSVPQSIHLPTLVTQGRITEIAASLEELVELRSQFTEGVNEGLDDGEAEALALLLAGRAKGYLFCSGDWAAIQALALAGLSEAGTSFEHVLKTVGAMKPLGKQFSEAFFQRALEDGQERRLRSLGLRNPSPF